METDNGLDLDTIRAEMKGQDWRSIATWRALVATITTALGLGRTAPSIETLMTALDIAVTRVPWWTLGTASALRIGPNGAELAISDEATDPAYEQHHAIGLRLLELAGAPLQGRVFRSRSETWFAAEGPACTIAAMLLVPEGMVRDAFGDDFSGLRSPRLDEATEARIDSLDARTWAGGIAFRHVELLAEERVFVDALVSEIERFAEALEVDEEAERSRRLEVIARTDALFRVMKHATSEIATLSRGESLEPAFRAVSR